MFDINKTIMRCLVKNIAMFGLGLYIYEGEDLPQEEEVLSQSKETNSSFKEKQSIDDLRAKLSNVLDLESLVVEWKQIYINKNAFSEQEILELETLKNELKLKFNK